MHQRAIDLISNTVCALCNKQVNNVTKYNPSNLSGCEILQTKNTYIRYGSNGSDCVIRAYCDASFGHTFKSNTIRHSNYGYVFTIEGDLIL